MFRCSVRARYEAALHIPGAGKGASRTHGHGYTVEAVLEAQELDELGFVVDFDAVQPELKRIAAELDHQLLNDLEPFAEGSPSAERQALHFYSRLTEALAHLFEGRVRVARVRITQEPDAWVEYEP